MNKKKTIAAVALLALAGVQAQAQTEVVVTKLSGGQEKFELADMSKLTFGDGAMSVVMLTKPVASLSLSDLQNIRFVSASDAIGSIVGDGSQGVRSSYDGDRLSVTGVDGSASAAVFTTDGRKMFGEEHWDGTSVDVSALPKGVYIFKVNNNTFKFIKK